VISELINASRGGIPMVAHRPNTSSRRDGMHDLEVKRISTFCVHALHCRPDIQAGFVRLGRWICMDAECGGTVVAVASRSLTSKATRTTQAPTPALHKGMGPGSRAPAVQLLALLPDAMSNSAVGHLISWATCAA